MPRMAKQNNSLLSLWNNVTSTTRVLLRQYEFNPLTENEIATSSTVLCCKCTSLLAGGLRRCIQVAFYFGRSSLDSSGQNGVSSRHLSESQSHVILAAQWVQNLPDASLLHAEHFHQFFYLPNANYRKWTTVRVKIWWSTKCCPFSVWTTILSSLYKALYNGRKTISPSLTKTDPLFACEGSPRIAARTQLREKVIKN